MSIAIVTDTNSGIMPEEAEQLGISVLPMPFFIDEVPYLEGISLSRADFFQKMRSGAEIHTSMPSPADVLDLWEKLLQTHDQVLYIPMSSGLSSSCATAQSLAQEEYPGRVFVVDNKRISITQRSSVMDALKLREQSLDAEKIREILEKDALSADVLVAVGTLKYLVKGGRVTPAGAAIGAALGIKPVLKISGSKLDAYAKVRGLKAAEQRMLDAMKQEQNVRYSGCPCTLMAAYGEEGDSASEWAEKVKKAFPDTFLQADPLPLSILCHLGPEGYGISCIKNLRY